MNTERDITPPYDTAPPMDVLQRRGAAAEGGSANDKGPSRHCLGWLVLAFGCLAVGVGAAEIPEPVSEVPPIVAKSIAFHGGEAYEHSRTELDMCSKSGCFHVEASVQGEEYSYQVTGLQRDTHLKVRVTNDAVDRWFDGHISPPPEDQAQRFRDWVMARVYFCFLPYRLMDPSVRYQDLGLVDWQGKQLHLVAVSFEPGSSTDASDQYRYWFDPETGRLELFAYSYEGEPGGLRFRRLVDHRRVGGLLFFDQENLGVEGEDLDIADIDATFVSKEMRSISKVTLRNIRVTPLP